MSAIGVSTVSQVLQTEENNSFLFYCIYYRTFQDLVEAFPNTCRQLAKLLTGDDTAGIEELRGILKKNPESAEQIRYLIYTNNKPRIDREFEKAPKIKRI
jgi:hypothetical protein